MYLSRPLEMGQTIGNKRAKLFLKFVAVNESVAQRDKCDGNLSSFAVGTADDATLLHRRMFQKNCFHLGRRYGESLVFDHLFATVDYPIEALTVPSHDVAGPIP